MKWMRLMPLMLGVILVILSAKPLFAAGNETYIGSRVNHQFKFDHIYVNFMELGKVEILGRGTPIPVDHISVENELSDGKERQAIQTMAEYVSMNQQPNGDRLTYTRTYKWAGQIIEIADQFQAGEFNSSTREQVNLHMSINHKDWSVEGPVLVRPFFLDDNRYHGYFGVLTVKEKGREKLVIIQRTSGTAFTPDKNLSWRILSIDSQGQVQEDRFTYDELSEVPQRVNMINITSASPFSLGYRSNILFVWPSLLFPLAYPIGTAIVGLLLVIIGLVKGLRHYRK
ncbi:hypothetical protein [Paenibacillus qinlingensis]|uniref:DUF3068 domain-containing protein n=1 Tax=Paenibacillus qinlingensis TaxID=1837343 RepID=A0ABU1P1A2_9BACL|nr:hypothetical protein [Paenibacillus qinlingensis]MDR6553513.1 hypothetical protein [Paenibacillus qinlingensis]